MEKKNVLFLGSKPIGQFCLKLLLNRENVRLKGVLTRDADEDVWWSSRGRVHQIAEDEGIPILSHEDITDLPVDFLISIQYHRILEPEVLSHPEEAAINLHMAPLPEYRGCNQFSFAIINCEDEFGTSLHYMEPDVDAGDLIAEKRFSIPDNVRVYELYKQTEDKSKQLFDEKIDGILAGENDRISQESLQPEREPKSYFRSDLDRIKEIELDWPAEKIHRHIRAVDFPPHSPPYVTVQGEKVYLTLEGARFE